MAFLEKLLDRLARPPEEIRAENLREWVSTIEGTTRLADLEGRKRQKVAGVVQNIRVDPRPGRNSIEATIIDGTGQMVVKWLGRHELSGIRLGAGLIVDGIVGHDHDGDCVILNPEYVLVPNPETG